MKIALTGATGNMGRATLAEILKSDGVEFVKVLVLPTDNRIKQLLKEYKKFRGGGLKFRSFTAILSTKPLAKN